eukprot:NODE_17_length_48642_cov_1.199349.p11 type:complete len:407 gc:universal NODE_17_length_48642_cov_1.199349:33763-34983(+)
MLRLISRSFQTRFHYKIIPFKLADIGEGIKECEVLQWYIKEGDHIGEFDKLCEVQSDKAAVEITSRYTGIIKKLHKNIGEIVQVGGTLVDIDIKGDDKESIKNTSNLKAEPNLPADLSKEAKIEPQRNFKIIATPSIRRIAREKKIDLHNVKGSGKNGRIMKEDIVEVSSAESEEPALDQESLIQNSIERAMFKSMSSSVSIPRFGYTDLFLTANLDMMKDKINSEIKAQNIKLSYMPFLIKAFSTACLHFPAANASLKGEQIYKNAFVNIGIAMDTPKGLMVPCIKHVQKKSILEINGELQVLIQKAKTNKLSIDDIRDATFTISNIGTIGGIYVHPVVPPGTTTIVGLGKTQYIQDPDSLVPKIVKCLPISLSADHRIVDGATSARFVQKTKELLNGSLLIYLK